MVVCELETAGKSRFLCFVCGMIAMYCNADWKCLGVVVLVHAVWLKSGVQGVCHCLDIGTDYDDAPLHPGHALYDTHHAALAQPAYLCSPWISGTGTGWQVAVVRTGPAD